jgi:hypothetical protein
MQGPCHAHASAVHPRQRCMQPRNNSTPNGKSACDIIIFSLQYNERTSCNNTHRRKHAVAAHIHFASSTWPGDNIRCHTDDIKTKRSAAPTPHQPPQLPQPMGVYGAIESTRSPAGLNPSALHETDRASHGHCTTHVSHAPSAQLLWSRFAAVSPPQAFPLIPAHAPERDLHFLPSQLRHQQA